MIKLTKHQPSPQETEIRIEGRLDAEGLAELRRLVGPPTAPDTVTLNLTGLRTIDPDGRVFLIDLRRSGCRLLGGSLYIKRLLEEA